MCTSSKSYIHFRHNLINICQRSRTSATEAVVFFFCRTLRTLIYNVVVEESHQTVQYNIKRPHGTYSLMAFFNDNVLYQSPQCANCLFEKKDCLFVATASVVEVRER